MPSADFCSAVRLPFDSLSPLRTQSRSPGVSSATFCAQSPNLRFAPLMDMDFAVSCPLVRRWRLISGFCPSTRTFDPCFFQTPPRGGSPCIITSPSPPSGWAEDLHLQAAEHAQHTTKPSAGGMADEGPPCRAAPRPLTGFLGCHGTCAPVVGRASGFGNEIDRSRPCDTILAVIRPITSCVFLPCKVLIPKRNRFNPHSSRPGSVQ